MSMRPGRWFPLLLVAALAAPAVSGAAAPAAEARPPSSVFLETQVPYFYEGDGIPVAMTVKNVSEKPVDNAAGLNLLGGLQLEDARGAKLKPAEGMGTLLTQPKSLEPGAFFGRVFPAQEVFPGLQKAGNYKLTWKGPGASGNELILHVVARFDTKKAYRLKIETDFGPIVIDLNQEAAPRHVRNLVDLARQGYYNGTQFHRIIPGVAITGGSPTGDPAAGTGYNLDPETSKTLTDAGTVVQVRNQLTGTMDSGSHFMILAVSRPEFTGKVSVLGKVTEGMDTVRTIAQVPTAPHPQDPPGAPERPIKPVLMRKVTVLEVSGKQPDRKAPAGAAPAKPGAGG